MAGYGSPFGSDGRTCPGGRWGRLPGATASELLVARGEMLGEARGLPAAERRQHRGDAETPVDDLGQMKVEEPCDRASNL